jgi:hypothetical protein
MPAQDRRKLKTTLPSRIVTISDDRHSYKRDIPVQFVDAVEKWLLYDDRRAIAILSLDDRTRHNWERFGGDILSQLLEGTLSFEIVFQGEQLFDLLLFWLQSSIFYNRPASVSLKWNCRPHTSIIGGTVQEMNWHSAHLTNCNEWIEPLWRQAGSEVFHFYSLIIAVYDKRGPEEFEKIHDIPSSEFTEVLSASFGWMIPLDENIGFIVGGTRELLGLVEPGSR